MSFQPAIALNSNPINFIDMHSLQYIGTHSWKMHTDKVKWIMLITVAGRNDIRSSLV